jgi:hypothetical protein
MIKPPTKILDLSLLDRAAMVMEAAVEKIRRRPLQSTAEAGICEAIGDAGDLHHFGDIVHADDVGAREDARGHSGGGAPDALFGRSRFAVMGESCSEEAFAGCAHEQGIPEFREPRKFFEQLVILREAFAEADAGIEDDLGFRDTRFARDGDGFS